MSIPKHARVTNGSEVSQANHADGGRGFDCDTLDNCPACWPSLYAVEFAKHRADKAAVVA